MTDSEIRIRAETYLDLEDNEEFRAEVEELLKQDNTSELNDRFWRDLDFGTGGIRGVIGGGFNRMNSSTICRATQGLANYIVSQIPREKHGVVIAYDSRRYSDTFAENAACVLAANGISAWLFSSLRPTPLLSFAVRNLVACAGIMITASHNPAQYNGYKVFWEDGAQIVAPHDKGIIAEVRRVHGPVAMMDRRKAEKQNLIALVDRKIDDAYRKVVIAQSLNPKMLRKSGTDIKVVYTPLHGTGTVLVEGVLRELGITVITVPEQREPDGDFPTVESPNPETASALEMALQLARKEKADLVMATDPDADRLGIAVPSGNEWVLLSGNRLGVLLTDYIFRTCKEQGKLPPHPVFVNTIVTTQLQNVIAEDYGARSLRVLTGFKYIGEKIRQFEADGLYTYVFGCEESYGYLVGTAVRDKDAVSTAAMTAEMILWNRERGLTPMQHLEELWRRFGYYEERLFSREFEGEEGQKAMNGLMKSLRTIPQKTIASIPVAEIKDFVDGSMVKDVDLPPSNVLQFVLVDGSLVTVRPSGTEPKIKFYVSCRSTVENSLSEIQDKTGEKIENIEGWVNALIASAHIDD